MERNKPTLGDRLKNSAIGAALGGAAMTSMWLLENGFGKMASKSQSILPVKGQWKITAGAAALMGVIGFFIAKKDEPEQSVAPTASADANTPMPASTKFRDRVSAQQQSSQITR